jgi:predicted anti-sigma-YlaC factor YlaD
MIIEAASSSHGSAIPLPFAIVLAVIAVIWMWQAWKPGGIYRRMGGRSLITRLASIVASACIVVYVAFLAAGQETLAIIIWVVGALATVPLLISFYGKSLPRETPDSAGQPETGAEQDLP